LGWCISLGLGLSTLINNPSVARETMGVKWASENAALWAPLGVGEYGVYTSFAICISPLISVAHSFLHAWRWLAYVVVCAGAASVLFSTFTGAAVLLVLGIFGTLFIWVTGHRGTPRKWRIIFALLTLALLAILYSQADLFPQTEFIVSKAERLFQRIPTEGLAQGDETGRGKMFLQDFESFAEEPFLGYIPRVSGQLDHAHSSLASSLVLFGIFGAALWFVTLGNIFRDSMRRTGSLVEKSALVIAWCALFLGGILNPIWYSPVALGAMFALTLPAVQSQSGGVVIDAKRRVFRPRVSVAEDFKR
jgi:hypothetical protein